MLTSAVNSIALQIHLVECSAFTPTYETASLITADNKWNDTIALTAHDSLLQSPPGYR